MKRVPPLQIWIIAISIFIIIQVVFYLIPPNKLDATISFPRNDTAILHDKIYNPTHKIIVLGSSITDEAIETEESILSMSIKNGGAPLLIKKLTGNNDKLAFLIDRYDLKNYIISEKPEAICIQTELAAIKLIPEHIFAPEFMVQQAQINKLIIKKIIAGFEDKTPAIEINPIDNEIKIVEDTLTFQAINRSVKTKKESQYVFDLIKLLKSSGIKTYFIDIPRAKQFEQKYFTNQYNDSLNNLFNIYNTETGSKRLEYTGPTLYFKNYRDIGGHMNITGRNIYTQWLVNTLQNELKK